MTMTERYRQRETVAAAGRDFARCGRYRFATMELGVPA